MAGLYLAAITMLTAPLIFWLGLADSREAFEIYNEWGFWAFAAVMFLAQALLLVVPVAVSEGRPVSRRKLLVPIITSGAMAGLLLFGISVSLFAGLFGDDWPGEENTAIGMVAVAVGSWIAWAVVFFRMTRPPGPEGVLGRLMKWLFRGSLLQLLVAVPSHVAARHRDDCCAPVITFWGIATGLSVMLLSLGPGVFFLYRERFQKLRGRPRDSAPSA